MSCYVPDSPLQNLLDFMLEPVSSTSHSYIVKFTSILISAVFVSAVSTATTIMIYRDYNHFDASTFNNFVNWVVSSNSIVISLQILFFLTLLMFRRNNEIITHMSDDSDDETCVEEETLISENSDNRSISEEQLCERNLDELLNQSTYNTQTVDPTVDEIVN